MANLEVPDNDLKMLREDLCSLQVFIHPTRTKTRGRINALINQIDRHRPLGPDGKHGDRHTDTCGCVDR